MALGNSGKKKRAFGGLSRVIFPNNLTPLAALLGSWLGGKAYFLQILHGVAAL